MKEKHEVDLKMAKEDYKKKLAYEDVKYANFDKKTHNTGKDMEKLNRWCFKILY